MVMGVIPVGGVPLPLISHGGSAMITMMVSFGILMSVQVHRDVEFANTENDLSSASSRGWHARLARRRRWQFGAFRRRP
jgi:hypothetical protein